MSWPLLTLEGWNDESTLFVVEMLSYQAVYTFLREHLADEELNVLALIGAGCDPKSMEKFDNDWKERTRVALYAFHSFQYGSNSL